MNQPTRHPYGLPPRVTCGGARSAAAALATTRQHADRQPQAEVFAAAPPVSSWSCTCGRINSTRADNCRGCRKARGS